MSGKISNNQISGQNKETSILSRRRRLTVTAVICGVAVLLAVFLAVGNALSWFIPQGATNTKAKLTPFSASMQYSIDGIGYSALASNVSIYPANVGTSSMNEVRLEDLRLRVVYSGKSSAFIRVKLYESYYYYETTTLKPTVATTSYSLASGWSLSNTDGYYYYNTPLSGENVNVDFVTFGSTATSAVTNEYFKLVAVIEEVQPDRAETFFSHTYS